MFLPYQKVCARNCVANLLCLLYPFYLLPCLHKVNPSKTPPTFSVRRDFKIYNQILKCYSHPTQNSSSQLIRLKG